MTPSGDYAHVTERRRKTRQVTIRLSPDDYQEAVRLARKLGLSLTAMFTHCMKVHSTPRRRR